jgi:hypothetical protein
MPAKYDKRMSTGLQRNAEKALVIISEIRTTESYHMVGSPMPPDLEHVSTPWTAEALMVELKKGDGTASIQKANEILDVLMDSNLVVRHTAPSIHYELTDKGKKEAEELQKK